MFFRNRYFIFAITIVSSLVSDPCFANRLEDVANRSTHMLVTLGQATSIIGILIGGIAMTLGMVQTGRIILSSGLFGAVCVFGGPAILDFLKGIFA